MQILHLFDSPPTGGATIAAKAIITCVGGTAIQKRKPPTRWQVAWRAVCGYRDRAFERSLTRTVRDDMLERPDLIVLHNFRDWGVSLIAWAQMYGIPVVWHCYDYWPLDPRCTCMEPFVWHRYQPAKGRRWPILAKLPLLGRQRRMRKWFNQLDAIVCLSKHSRFMLRSGGIMAPIHLVPLPITVPDMQVARNPNVVLYLGGEVEHKGVGVFREAIRIVQAQRPDVICKMVNEPNRDVALREIASAACLVAPEQWPNMAPLVCAEAQLLGTPVVASDIGGIPEMGLTFYAPPQDAAVFAREILTVLSPKRCGFDSLAFLTKLKAEQRHDPVRVRKQLEEVYGCALDHHRIRGRLWAINTDSEKTITEYSRRTMQEDDSSLEEEAYRC